MWPNPQFSADLVSFTEEILNRKLHSLRCDFLTVTCPKCCEQPYYVNITDLYKETSIMEPFCENNGPILPVNHFHKKP